MTHTDFTTALSDKMSMMPARVDSLLQSFGQIMAELGVEQDTVAIPGFGTFKSIYTTEQITTDAASQTRTLIPPAIRLTFRPSIVLRKKFGL